MLRVGADPVVRWKSLFCEVGTRRGEEKGVTGVLGVLTSEEGANECEGGGEGSDLALLSGQREGAR